MAIVRKGYVNAKIYCGNDKIFNEVLITNNNLIEFVGSKADAENRGLLSNVDELIDLDQKLVLPGFIDCHVHTVMGGFYLLGIDLQQAKSKDNFIEEIKKFITKRGIQHSLGISSPLYNWIQGGNWNEQNWEKVELPRKEWIDSFTENIPVFVSRMDYHQAFANSCALKLAGITKDTESPAGGEIQKDPISGEPTGILRDKAMDLVKNVIPPPTEIEMEKAALTTLAEANRFGVTSYHEICYDNDFRILQKLEREGKLTCRVFARLPIERIDAIIETQIEAGFGSSMLRTGSLKAFADGSLGSSTALFFDNYENEPNNFGLAMEILENGSLREWIIKADKNHLQLSVHAIGDKANSMILDIVEEIRAKNARWDRRFRLEHAQHLEDKDFERIADLDVIVSAQPYHLYDDGSWAVDKIGQKRLKNMMALNRMLNKNIKLCFGSDFPVVSINPLLGIYEAVTRHTSNNKNLNGLNESEKITVKQAVDCYTKSAAYASFEEDLKGSLEEGKLADFVVLNEDIFTIDQAQIKDVKVLKTVLDGKTLL